MGLSAVSVLVVAQSSSEIPEALMNNPVLFTKIYSMGVICKILIRNLFWNIFKKYEWGSKSNVICACWLYSFKAQNSSTDAMCVSWIWKFKVLLENSVVTTVSTSPYCQITDINDSKTDFRCDCIGKCVYVWLSAFLKFQKQHWLLRVLFCVHRAGHSSRGVLPSVVCLSVITNPR